MASAAPVYPGRGDVGVMLMHRLLWLPRGPHPPRRTQLPQEKPRRKGNRSSSPFRKATLAVAVAVPSSA
ncbi:hypothetical protein U9M48_042301 [Paspalum notatum var. saurae]|uniref:Uncharacterized protein n=1 Tax=Paspalum notatum var. saurae TaxID=547442 RepID=A0AAQ3UUI0_PASNO